MRTLTHSQQAVLSFIRDFQREQQCSPTRAEISRHMGYRSANAAEEHLKRLALKGAVKLTAGRSRGIYVMPDFSESTQPLTAEA